MLKWIDEFAYITANIEYPGNTFLTKAMDNVVFWGAVKSGEIIRFDINLNRIGNTSIQYGVKAFGTRVDKEADKILFETNITFVAVDDSGCKASIVR